MKLKKILLAIIIWMFSTNLILAGTDEENNLDTSDTQSGYIEVSAKLATQSVFNKQVPIKISFTPHIEGKKGYIEVSGSSGLQVINSPLWVDITKEKTHTYTIYVKPQKAGKYTISASVVIFGYSTNYSDSTNIDITVNNALIVEETKSGYIGMSAIIFMIGLLVAVGIIIFVVKYGKVLLEKLRKWLMEPKKSQISNQQQIEQYYSNLYQQGQQKQKNGSKQ